jgi:hypothetical protein
MNIRNIALVLSIIFVAIGILGFIPALTPDGKLLGIFGVNTLHNIVHLATGLAGLYAVYMGGANMVRMFGQVFGVVYALVTILGFLGAINTLLNIDLNDNLLHLVLSAALLYIGFAGEPSSASTPASNA